MEAVEEAARKARYNEAIVVKVSAENSPDDESTEIVLTATLDEENGGVVWNQVTANNNEDVGIVRHLRTKRWVLPMLNDNRRNDLYFEAVRAASCEAVSRFHTTLPDEPTIRALDIGTGTGLLAMMSCKHLREAELDAHAKRASEILSPVAVTSLEMASAMARLAKLTIASNKLQDSIHLLEEHSCEVNLPHKFILCTSELLESGLLAEGILPSLRDAWERHLHPNAVVVPQRARVYAQLIESSELVGSYVGPHSPRSSDDDASPSISLRTSSSDESGVLLGGNVIAPIHAESLFSLDPPARILTGPVEVMDISFEKDSIPGPDGQSRTITIEPTASGVAHGVLFWWELDLWKNITYSTQQGKEPWQDHWQQCLFVLGNPVRIEKGQAVCLGCSHTDDRLSFAVGPYPSESNQEPERDVKRQRVDVHEATSSPRLISPERALQLNDHDRVSLIRHAIKFALQDKGKDAHFLDISDFSLCAILAAVEGATAVSSLESSSGEVPTTAARVSQANGLPLIKDGEAAQYQILQCHVGNLTLEAFDSKPVSIVAAEPYYEVLEGWHLQEALNYFYVVRSLRKRGLVHKNVTSIPCYASIMVCGIECETLAQAYQGCGDDSKEAQICGFKHEHVKNFADRYHLNGISIRACEYKYTQLTESKEVLRLCFDDSSAISGNGVETQIKFKRAGTCHGILLWIDYGMRVGKEENMILSTSNKRHRQLFQLLPSPKAITKDDVVESSTLLCRLQLGELDGTEDMRLEARVERVVNDNSS